MLIKYYLTNEKKKFTKPLWDEKFFINSENFFLLIRSKICDKKKLIVLW
jgi:hypothetical protein